MMVDWEIIAKLVWELGLIESVRDWKPPNPPPRFDFPGLTNSEETLWWLALDGFCLGHILSADKPTIPELGGRWRLQFANIVFVRIRVYLNLEKHLLGLLEQLRKIIVLLLHLQRPRLGFTRMRVEPLSACIAWMASSHLSSRYCALYEIHPRHRTYHPGWPVSGFHGW